MRHRLQFSVLSSAKGLFVSLGVMFAGLLAFESNVLAATAVDVYQDMQSGNNGDALTATIMNASSHPSSGWWTPSGTVWVSTSHYMDLPGPVIVGGVTYNGTGGSRTWVFNNNNPNNFVQHNGSASSRVTVACYYTTDATITNSTQYDTIGTFGSLGKTFSVMQTMQSGGHPNIRAHSKNSTGVSTFSDMIALTAGKTYWVNLNYNAATVTTSVAAFDPANSFAQVGSTVSTLSAADTEANWGFGRFDNHGSLSTDTTQSWFGQIVIDSTNGTFPLIPSGGTDSTPPSAPARCATAPAPISCTLPPLLNCQPIGMPPPTHRAASADTSMPSARRPAAHRPSISPRWAT